jgi:heme exporter protein C
MNVIKDWYKYLGLSLVLISLWLGLTINVPALPILNESIRNLFFHVPMWFSMFFCIILSVIYSVLYLRKANLICDMWAKVYTEIALLFGSCGLLTGMLWAKFTWGVFWTNDPKLNGTAISMLIYMAYFILRNSIEYDEEKRAKIASVYNIFAFSAYFPIVFILPRMTDSLHPGNGGNPAFNTYDLDNIMRPVFYTAVMGWILIAFWLAQIRFKLTLLTNDE